MKTPANQLKQLLALALWCQLVTMTEAQAQNAQTPTPTSSSTTPAPFVVGGMVVGGFLFLCCVCYASYWLAKHSGMIGQRKLKPSPLDDPNSFHYYPHSQARAALRDPAKPKPITTTSTFDPDRLITQHGFIPDFAVGLQPTYVPNQADREFMEMRAQGTWDQAKLDYFNRLRVPPIIFKCEMWRLYQADQAAAVRLGYDRSLRENLMPHLLDPAPAETAELRQNLQHITATPGNPHPLPPTNPELRVIAETQPQLARTLSTFGCLYQASAPPMSTLDLHDYPNDFRP